MAIIRSSEVSQPFKGDDVVESEWKKTSFFGARERINAKIDSSDNSRIKLQMVSQSAFEHFLNWVGFKEQGSIEDWNITGISLPKNLALKKWIVEELTEANKSSGSLNKIFFFLTHIQQSQTNTSAEPKAPTKITAEVPNAGTTEKTTSLASETLTPPPSPVTIIIPSVKTVNKTAQGVFAEPSPVTAERVDTIDTAQKEVPLEDRQKLLGRLSPLIVEKTVFQNPTLTEYRPLNAILSPSELDDYYKSDFQQPDAHSLFFELDPAAEFQGSSNGGIATFQMAMLRQELEKAGFKLNSGKSSNDEATYWQIKLDSKGEALKSLEEVGQKPFIKTFLENLQAKGTFTLDWWGTSPHKSPRVFSLTEDHPPGTITFKVEQTLHDVTEQVLKDATESTMKILEAAIKEQWPNATVTRQPAKDNENVHSPRSNSLIATGTATGTFTISLGEKKETVESTVKKPQDSSNSPQNQKDPRLVKVVPTTAETLDEGFLPKQFALEAEKAKWKKVRDNSIESSGGGLLISPSNKPGKVEHKHQNYYVGLALLNEALEKIPDTEENKPIRTRLKELMLTKGGKTASFKSHTLIVDQQQSPVDRLASAYHRMATSQSIENINTQLTNNIFGSPQRSRGQLVPQPFKVQVIEDSTKEHLFRDVLKRIYGNNYVEINSLEELKDDPDKIFDVSKILPPIVDPKTGKPNNLKQLLSNLRTPNLIAFSELSGESLLLSSSKISGKILDESVSFGFSPTPERVKQVMLKLKPNEGFLPAEVIADVHLSTLPANKEQKTENSISSLCENLRNVKTVQIRESTGPVELEENNDDSMTLIMQATLNLLEGLTDKRIDETFESYGLENLLQFTYQRIKESWYSAYNKKNDPQRCMSHIDLIHQEIQTLLAIAQPYKENAFESATTERFKTLSPSLNPETHFRASGMRAISSVFAGVEKQMGTQNLNVLVQKDCYYEVSGAIDRCAAYTTSKLDGDLFLDNPEGATKDATASRKKFNVFLAEFNHNISPVRREYHKEEITKQVKTLFQKELVEFPLTVILDTTLDFELSDNFRSFLEDSDIKKWINDGSLNVTFARSGQKYDMLGMDNYSAGIATVVNNRDTFKAFNEEMQRDTVEVSTQNYQGMAHLASCAGKQQDAYRQHILENTQALYKSLPQNLLASEGNKSPLQVAINNDDQMFLSIMFESVEAREKFHSNFFDFARENGFFLSSRSSFGFASCNLTTLDEDSTVSRLTLGLESEESLKAYQAYFQSIGRNIQQAKSRNESFNFGAFDPPLVKDNKSYNDSIGNARKLMKELTNEKIHNPGFIITQEFDPIIGGIISIHPENDYLDYSMFENLKEFLIDKKTAIENVVALRIESEIFYVDTGKQGYHQALKEVLKDFSAR